MKHIDKDHTIISWKAPEFARYKKGGWWFPVQAIVTVALTLLFILTNQYLVAIIVVLGAYVIYRLAHQEPEILSVNFSTQGITFKSKYYPFRQLKTFWIIDTGETYRLHLQPIERLGFPVIIPLIAEDVEKVRDFLSHYLPETHNAEEDLADRINRILRI
jgi:hypothetical protein